MRRPTFLVYAAAMAACWLLAVAAGALGQDAPPNRPDGTPTAETSQDAVPAGTEEADQNKVTSLMEELAVKGLWNDTPWTSWVWLLLAIFVGMVVGRIVAAVLGQVAARTRGRGWLVRTHVVDDLIGPAKLAILTLGIFVGLAGVRMEPNGTLEGFCKKTILLLYSISVFWYLFNLVAVIDVMLRRFTAKTESTLDDQFVPLIRKTLRVFLVVIGILFVVGTIFECNIGAWLAGLGIAGLAVSLAAQDSIKNLFGSITILLDQPFLVGDRIAYAGYDGVIEEIGFRSTKVRTLTGHMVTIPNSNIVNDPVENIAQRKSIRRIMNVTITYDTSREKIEQAVQILRDILEEDDLREPIHAVIDGDEFPPRVYFNDYNAESLNILLIYWFAPPTYWDYLDHAQRLNLRIFEEFERAGIEFAFPTQTVYLAGDPKRELAVQMLGKDM